MKFSEMERLSSKSKIKSIVKILSDSNDDISNE